MLCREFRRESFKDLNYIDYMFACQVFVLYVRISLRIAIKHNNVIIYTPVTLFCTVEIEILRRKQVFK